MKPDEKDVILLHQKLMINPGVFESHIEYSKRYMNEVYPVFADELHFTDRDKDAFEIGYATGLLCGAKLQIMDLLKLTVVMVIVGVIIIVI